MPIMMKNPAMLMMMMNKNTQPVSNSGGVSDVYILWFIAGLLVGALVVFILEN